MALSACVGKRHVLKGLLYCSEWFKYFTGDSFFYRSHERSLNERITLDMAFRGLS